MSRRACAWCDAPAVTQTDRNWPACKPHADRAARLAADVLETKRQLVELELEARAAADPIIRYAEVDGRTEFDEFVAHDVKTVHFEAMSDNQFWIGITLRDGRSWAINCGAKNPNVKGFAICEED